MVERYCNETAPARRLRVELLASHIDGFAALLTQEGTPRLPCEGSGNWSMT
jgi:hypothetical protein